MRSTFNNLAQVSHDAVFRGLLSSLSKWVEQHPSKNLVPYRSLVGGLVVALRDTVHLANEQAVIRHLHENQAGYASDEPAEHPDNELVLSAIWRLVNLGFVYPRLREHRDGYPHIVDNVVITPDGRRMLANLGTHPASPSFAAETRAACPGLSEDALLRFEDAVGCLFHRMLRPAVVMVGLAYEEIVGDVVEALAKQGRLTAPGWKQRARIQALQQFLASLPKKGPKLEERHRASIALVAAEQVRVERNRASHPGERFDDHEAVDRLILLAGQVVPDLWETRNL